MQVKQKLALLPLRDIVVFPSMVIPLFVGRDKSITALNEVMQNTKKIILVTQKNSEIDDPKKTDVFTYGCESNILQLLKLPDGTVKVLVEGTKRVKILEFEDDQKFYYLAPLSIKVGDKIENGSNIEIKTGNCMPLKDIPVGINVHNVELIPGAGGKVARSAGTFNHQAKGITGPVPMCTIFRPNSFC